MEPPVILGSCPTRFWQFLTFPARCLQILQSLAKYAPTPPPPPPPPKLRQIMVFCLEFGELWYLSKTILSGCTARRRIAKGEEGVGKTRS